MIEYVFQDSRSWTSFSTAITHNTTANFIICCLFGARDDTLDKLHTQISEARALIEAPILVPTLMKGITSRFWNTFVNKWNSDLFQAERSIGMKVDLGTTIESDLTKVDFDNLVRSLNSISTELAFASLASRTSLQMLSCLSSINNTKRSSVGNATGKEKDGTDEPVSVSSVLSARIAYLQSWHQGIDERCSYLIRRAQFQVQTVSTFLSHGNIDVDALSGIQPHCAEE